MLPCPVVDSPLAFSMPSPASLSAWFQSIRENPDTATLAASGNPNVIDALRIGSNSSAFLVLGERLEHELTDTLLRVGVGDGPQQREAASLTVDGVLARRERDVAATTAATLPHGEPDQLQAAEFAVGEMQLGIREFAGRVAFVVRRDLDGETHSVTSWKARDPRERLTRTSEVNESCSHPGANSPFEALPEAELQRGQAGKPRVGLQQQV